MQMPGDKQRVLAAANVWSYPMAVDLSFREKRAPQVLQHEKTTSVKQLHESLKLLPSIVSVALLVAKSTEHLFIQKTGTLSKVKTHICVPSTGTMQHRSKW